jgi:hypothetical protein
MRDEVMVARDKGVTAEVRQVMSTTSTRASTTIDHPDTTTITVGDHTLIRVSVYN